MTKTPKISLRGLYKIFGRKPEAVLEHVLNGMDRNELMEKHKHVLGLRDINVDMQPGEITVVMGLSGSGKSTLIRHLNRLIEPTAGEIWVNGEDITKLSSKEIQHLRQHKMSMIFQKFALLPHRTVLQNTAMPLAIQNNSLSHQEAEASRWIERVGLNGFENHYPVQLSGGMQQRVGIARALASNTDIMLMDEAFSALDPLIRTDMQNLLLELQTELHKTIVFITHDLDEALKLADHLVILKDGALIQQGDPQDILINPCDPYIEEFISDINRVRVLRVRSVMTSISQENFDGEIDVEDNLEKPLSLSNGDIKKIYKVVDQGQAIGQLEIKTLLKALVTRSAGFM
jgi:glycine betaine/proline transport system ATP-binding protein